MDIPRTVSRRKIERTAALVRQRLKDSLYCWDMTLLAIFLRRVSGIARNKFGRTCQATHMVKSARRPIAKAHHTISGEGKPMRALIEEVLDWARQQSQAQQSRAS